MRPSYKTPCLLLLLIGLLVISTACTGAQTKKEDKTKLQTQYMELDPMLIRSGKNGSKQALEADEVFKRAYQAYANRQYEEAISHYNAIIKYFPKSRFYLSSLFNVGLAYEKLERWQDSARHYKIIIEQFPKKKDAKDAYFRLANVNEKLNEHKQTIDLMTQVMLRPDINHFDRIEAHVRRSQALMLSGRLVEAQQGFQSTIRLNANAPAGERLADNARYIVQAQYGLGRAYHLQVRRIPLVLPTKKMGVDLDRKANLFLKAQGAYIRALRVHHAQWSVAAGYMIGRLYEDFYVDIFSAEIPKGLTDEQISLYFEELRKQLRPLMVRAIQVYKKNLSLSQRIVADTNDSRWTKVTSTHLKRLQAYLNDPFTQRRAERLVLQKRPLKHLWNPHMMAKDAVDEARDKANKATKTKKKSKGKKTNNS